MSLRERMDLLYSAHADNMEEVFAEVMDPACEITTPSGTHTGTEAMVEYGLELFKALPDLVHKVVHSVEEGDWVAVEVLISGTHTGPLVMASGELPPSGRFISYKVANFCQFRDGKLILIRQYHDRMEMMSQFGLST